jgi:hypothetical protein
MLVHAISDSEILILAGYKNSGSTKNVSMLDTKNNQMSKHGQLLTATDSVDARSCFSNGQVWLFDSRGFVEVYDV